MMLGAYFPSGLLSKVNVYWLENKKSSRVALRTHADAKRGHAPGTTTGWAPARCQALVGMAAIINKVNMQTVINPPLGSQKN